MNDPGVAVQEYEEVIDIGDTGGLGTIVIITAGWAAGKGEPL